MHVVEGKRFVGAEEGDASHVAIQMSVWAEVVQYVVRRPYGEVAGLVRRLEAEGVLTRCREEVSS